MMEAIRTHLARRKAGLADTYRTLVRKLAFPNALDAAPTPGEVARVAGELGIEAEQIDRDIEAEKISRRRRMKILVSSMTPRPLSLHPSECFPMDGWINNPDSISIADIEFDPYPDQPAAEFKAALEVIRLKKEGAIVPLADKLEILKSEGFEKRDPRQSWKRTASKIGPGSSSGEFAGPSCWPITTAGSTRTWPSAEARCASLSSNGHWAAHWTSRCSRPDRKSGTSTRFLGRTRPAE